MSLQLRFDPTSEALGSNTTPRVRIPTGIRAIDQCTGGGIPRGLSVVILGVPSCGKSTLGLQIAACTRGLSLYVAAEWSASQAHERYLSLGMSRNERHQTLETEHVEDVVDWINNHRPDVAVVDSWQALHVRNTHSSAERIIKSLDILNEVCSDTNTALVIVSKTRKDKTFRGPQDALHKVTGAVLRLRKLANFRREIVVDKTRIGPDIRRKLVMDGFGLRSPRPTIANDDASE